MTDHFLIRHYDPPVYGDRPEPWRVYFTCGCGEELWDEEEGYGSTPGTPDEALQDHLDDLTRTETEDLPQQPDGALTVTWHGPSRARPYPYPIEDLPQQPEP